MIVLNTENNFWSSVVATLDIEEASGAVLATGPEIYDFNPIIPLIRKKYILRLHVAMNDRLILHVFQSLTNLSRDQSKLFRLEHRVVSFVYLLVFVKIVAKALENYHHVLSELKAIDVLN